MPHSHSGALLILIPLPLPPPARVVRLTSPNLNYLIILGAILLYTTVYFFVIPTSVAIVQTVNCHVSTLSVCVCVCEISFSSATIHISHSIDIALHNDN